MAEYKFKDFIIRGEDGDWTLTQTYISTKGKTKDQEQEKIIGYWPRFEHVLEKIVRIDDSAGGELNDYIKRIENAIKELKGWKR